MSVSTLNQWFGRLGNNIQQISNAIYFCKENKLNFYCPRHSMIEPYALSFGNDSAFSSRFFFFNGVEKDFICDEEGLAKNRKSILENYLTPRLKTISIEIPETTLVIHIRGGDIFINSPHRFYVQNPLAFYLPIINKYDKTIVVCEDHSNPIVAELSRIEKVSIQSSSVQGDFSTLLSATNLVTSGVGTFGIAAAFCSKKIKNLYCTDLFLQEHMNPLELKQHSSINVEITKLNNYIAIGEWQNSIEQRKKMLNYEV